MMGVKLAEPFHSAAQRWVGDAAEMGPWREGVGWGGATSSRDGHSHGVCSVHEARRVHPFRILVFGVAGWQVGRCAGWKGPMAPKARVRKPRDGEGRGRQRFVSGFYRDECWV